MDSSFFFFFNAEIYRSKVASNGMKLVGVLFSKIIRIWGVQVP